MGLDVFNPAEPGMEGAVHIYTIFTKGGLSRELSPNPSLLVLLLGSSLFCQHHKPHICFHCHNRYHHHHQRHHQYHLFNPPHTLNIFFITGNLRILDTMVVVVSRLRQYHHHHCHDLASVNIFTGVPWLENVYRLIFDSSSMSDVNLNICVAIGAPLQTPNKQNYQLSLFTPSPYPGTL